MTLKTADNLFFGGIYGVMILFVIFGIGIAWYCWPSDVVPSESSAAVEFVNASEDFIGNLREQLELKTQIIEKQEKIIRAQEQLITQLKVQLIPDGDP